jgi:hypothetical protein
VLRNLLPYLAVNVALDESLPLLDHGPELVCSQVHPVEVGDAVLALKQDKLLENIIYNIKSRN